MMWSNAASLLAGGGAVYLNFDTASMQKSSLIGSGVAVMKMMRSPYERWVNIQSSYTDSRGKFSYGFENLY